MSNDFEMKAGSLLPELEATFVYDDGSPVNLTGASIAFTMQAADASKKIDGAAGELVDATAGRVKYVWAGTDTDTSGNYSGEFVATIGGKPLKAPVRSCVRIAIHPSISS